MRPAIMAAIVVMFAPAFTASAGIATWSWTVDNPLVTPQNPTVRAELRVRWDPHGVGFAGSMFDILNLGGGETGTITFYDGWDDLGRFTEEDGILQPDNSITGVELFQLPPFFNQYFIWDSMEVVPVYVFEWTTTDFSERTVSFEDVHLYTAIYIDTFGRSKDYDSTTTGVGWTVVPAPASGALLCAAPCVLRLARRRSSHGPR